MSLKVSIITVSLNAEETIERTINSVLGQTYPEIEYLIIDGKSTDNTMEIVNKYASRIHYICSEPDSGIYNAINKGIEKSSGEIIGILNSDDFYDSNAVKNAVESFIKYDSDVVYGEIKTQKRDGEFRNGKMFPFCDLPIKMVINHPTCFIKRSAYNKVGVYDESFKIAADYDLICRLAINGCSFTYNEKILAYFSDMGISSTNNVVCADETNRVSLNYIDKWPIKDKYWGMWRRTIFRNRWNMICNEASTDGILSDALNELIGNRQLFIFGAGPNCRKVVDIISSDSEINVQGIIDNDPMKWGTNIKGIEIISSGQFSKYEGEKDVIVTTKGANANIIRWLCSIDPSITVYQMDDIIEIAVRKMMEQKNE